MFTWSAYPGATHSRLIVKRPGAEKARISLRVRAERVCVDNLCTLDLENRPNIRSLPADRPFQWRVRALAGDVVLSVSGWQAFRITPRNLCPGPGDEGCISPVPSATRTPSRTPTHTATRTPTRTATRTATRTPSRTPTRTATPTSGVCTISTVAPTRTPCFSITGNCPVEATPSLDDLRGLPDTVLCATSVPSPGPGTPTNTHTPTFTRTPTKTNTPTALAAFENEYGTPPKLRNLMGALFKEELPLLDPAKSREAMGNNFVNSCGNRCNRTQLMQWLSSKQGWYKYGRSSGTAQVAGLVSYFNRTGYENIADAVVGESVSWQGACTTNTEIPCNWGTWGRGDVDYDDIRSSNRSVVTCLIVQSWTDRDGNDQATWPEDTWTDYLSAIVTYTQDVALGNTSVYVPPNPRPAWLDDVGKRTLRKGVFYLQVPCPGAQD